MIGCAVIAAVFAAAACSSSSSDSATDPSPPEPPKTAVENKMTSDSNTRAPTPPTPPTPPTTGHATLLELEVSILGQSHKLALPYAKEGSYLAHVASVEAFDKAFRVQGVAILSSDASVADRLRKIDALRKTTHEAYVAAGGSGRVPAVPSFDSALHDLVLAYFNATKDAILSSAMSSADKKKKLEELRIDGLDVLAWSPMLKSAVAFFADEGAMMVGP